MNKKSILIFVFLLCITKISHAIPLPNCNTESSDCKKWRAAVSDMNKMSEELDTLSGERGTKPRRSINRQKAINSCKRYYKNEKNYSDADAEAACKDALAP